MSIPVRLFVANFPADTTDQELEWLFWGYGCISAKVWVDFKTAQTKEFGFVEVEDGWAADRAIEDLNGKRWHGRKLKVQRAREKDEF
jgi:RNA recognition motif-containing protein